MLSPWRQTKSERNFNEEMRQKVGNISLIKVSAVMGKGANSFHISRLVFE